LGFTYTQNILMLGYKSWFELFL